MDLSHPCLRKLASSPGNIEEIEGWMQVYLGCNRVVNWRDMRRLGIRNELEDLVRYEVDGEEHSALYNLFSIDEGIYREVVTEFMITFEFHERREINDKRKITFKYRGKTQSLSLGDFGVYLGLYTQSQAESEWFLESFQSLTSLPTRGHKEVWRDLAGTDFRSNVKSSTMVKPEHHALHKLLCCSLFGKKEGGATTSEELRLMEALIMKRNLNIAYMLAERMRKEKRGEKNVFSGAFITRLLSSMGLLTMEHRDECSRYASSQPFDLEYCRLIRMIYSADDKQCYWSNTGLPIPGCSLARRRRDAPVREVDPTPVETTGPSAAATGIAHERGTSTTVQPFQAVVNYTDPVTPLTQYYLLHALQVSRDRDADRARRAGEPEPEPLLYRCGPPPPPPSSTTRPHSTFFPQRRPRSSTAYSLPIPTTRHSFGTESAYSLHASPLGRQSLPRSTIPTHVQSHHPEASTSYRPNLIVPSMGSIGEWFDGPMHSDQVPSETLLRQTYLGMIERAGVTAQTVRELGYDDVQILPSAELRDLLIRLGLFDFEEQRISSGQRSVAGPAQSPPSQTNRFPGQDPPF